MPLLHTIGYAGLDRDSFMRTLAKFGITALVDVRSVPYSRHFPEYNRDALEERLRTSSIAYLSFAREFGARQENRAWYSGNCLDFEKFRKSDRFLSGCRRIEDGLARNYQIALLCSETDPVTCHRAILIARWFSLKSYTVRHIVPDGILSQDDIDANLLHRFFPNEFSFTNSILTDLSMRSLLPGMPSREERIAQAYRLQNVAIYSNR